MPIKQVTCSICGQTVNKAVTYSVGKDQRACKVHEGAVEKRDAAEQARVEKLTAPPKPPPAPVWSDLPPTGIPAPRCWVCMNEGLSQQEFFLRVLVEMEKNKLLKGPHLNIFAPGGMPVLDERCILLVPREKAEAAMKYVREEFAMLVNMTGGFLAICGPCCGTFKIDALPPVDKEGLAIGMALQAVIGPAIKATAVQELARDN